MAETKKPHVADEVLDLVIHMNKVATNINCRKYEPSEDPDYQKLATNFYRLAGQLRAFINKKRNLEVTPETPAGRA